MPRPILFRGTTLNRHYVFGDLIHDDQGLLIFNGGYYRVSRADQLIAVDKNYQKIFERDIVKRIREFDPDSNNFVEVCRNSFAATFEDYPAILDAEIVFVKEAKP